VAFLDGEISESERRTIERRLTDEPELTQRLGELRETWQLLDHLTPAAATDDFTKTTISMTAIRSRRNALARFLGRRWKTMAGMCAALAVGYFVVFLPLKREQQERLRDVPVISNFDLYLHAESVEFLRQLDADGLFAQDIDLDEELSAPGMQAAVENPANEAHESIPAENRVIAGDAAPTSVLMPDADRIQDFLDGLNPEQRAELSRKRTRFEGLKPAVQERLRTLHRELVADPHSERLYQVLVRYQQWLKTPTSSQRAELAGLSPPDRLDRIRHLRQDQERRRFVELSDKSNFNPDDASVVMQWLGDYLEHHADDLIRRVPPHIRGFLQGQSDPQRRRRALGFAVLRFGDQMELPVPSPQEFEELALQLSPKLAKELRSVKDADTKSQLVRGWLRARMLSATAPPPVSEEDLVVFYTEELPPEEQERLERLPAHEMHDQLEQIYYRTKYPRYGGSGRFRRSGGRPPRRRGDDQRGPPPDDRFPSPPPPRPPAGAVR
jgi:hypothetical protein